VVLPFRGPTCSNIRGCLLCGLGDGRPDWNGTTRPGPELLTLRATHGHDMAIVNGIGRIGYLRGGQSALWEEANIADALVWQVTTGS